MSSTSARPRISAARRLQVEQKLLDRYFPGFRIAKGAATGVLRTNSDRDYGVRLDLDGFPNAMPRAYLLDPELRTHGGRRLSSLVASAAHHVLDADGAGNPQVCHWRAERWAPQFTLYQVVFKVRIWLEAYEAHLRTGLPLDHYLPHAKA